MITMTLEQILVQSHSPDPTVRRRILHDLCPCELKADHPAAWSRILELCRDEALDVRKAALHTLTDGSPRERAGDIVRAMESMYNEVSCHGTHQRSLSWPTAGPLIDLRQRGQFFQRHSVILHLLQVPIQHHAPRSLTL